MKYLGHGRRLLFTELVKVFCLGIVVTLFISLITQATAEESNNYPLVTYRYLPGSRVAGYLDGAFPDAPVLSYREVLMVQIEYSHDTTPHAKVNRVSGFFSGNDYRVQDTVRDQTKLQNDPDKRYHYQEVYKLDSGKTVYGYYYYNISTSEIDKITGIALKAINKVATVLPNYDAVCEPLADVIRGYRSDGSLVWEKVYLAIMPEPMSLDCTSNGQFFTRLDRVSGNNFIFVGDGTAIIGLQNGGIHINLATGDPVGSHPAVKVYSPVDAKRIKQAALNRAIKSWTAQQGLSIDVDTLGRDRYYGLADELPVEKLLIEIENNILNNRE